MENAIDALKIAFAAFIFVIALTVAITMFSQLNNVSQIVLASSDITNFYTYNEVDYGKRYRIVGLETIIPTLYKYYRENYTVLFLDQNEEPLPLYESQTDRDLWGSGIDPTTGTNPNAGIIGIYYAPNEDDSKNYDYNSVCAFDVEEETIRHEPWTGNANDFKENLDAFLNGDYFAYPSGGVDDEGRSGYDYSDYIRNGFMNEYAGDKFKEFLGEYEYDITTQYTNDDNDYEYDESNELLKQRKKRVIVYQLQQ